MYPSQFEYHRPSSVADAIKLLVANPDAKVLAGGHSLIPAMKLRLAQPAALVDIGRIGELKGISVNGDATIGAMTTYREAADSAELKAKFPVIAEAINMLGDPAVRARGTMGGALAHSDPAADMPAVLLALNSSVTATGSGGSRTIALDDLFVDLFMTSLAPDELITKITIPAGSAALRASYKKHAHPASGYAVVGVAAAVQMAGGVAQAIRVAVTGAGAKATRASAVEAALQGKPLTADSIAAAAAHAADGIDLNSDVYASADYRAHLTSVLARRAIAAAAGL